MTHDDIFDTDLPSDIVSVLSDELVWEHIDPSLEGSILDALRDEIAASPRSGSGPGVSAPNQRRVGPTGWRAGLLGAAAALVLVALGVGIVRVAGGDQPDFEVALAATELAPNASATAEITDTPAGTRIVIHIDELPPAAPGTYYEAWLRVDGEVGVSAGTFHFREPDDEIELWAGVSTDDYPLFTITLQQEAQTESSGQVVLKVLLDG